MGYRLTTGFGAAHKRRKHKSSEMISLGTPQLIAIMAMLASLYFVQATVDDTYFIRTVAGNGANALIVNVPALEASFTQPRGIVQSQKGDLYFASYNKNVVLKVEFDRLEGTSNVTVIAGIGSPGKGDDNILATDSALSGPMSVSLVEDDVSGDVKAIIISELNNNRVRKLDMQTKMIDTIAGKGTGSDGGSAVNAKIATPQQAYYDKLTGDLFIVEGGSSKKIRRVFASNGIITTVVGQCTNTENNGDGGQALYAC